MDDMWALDLAKYTVSGWAGLGYDGRVVLASVENERMSGNGELQQSQNGHVQLAMPLARFNAV